MEQLAGSVLNPMVRMFVLERKNKLAASGSVFSCEKAKTRCLYGLGPELIAIGLDVQLNFQQNDTNYTFRSMFTSKTYVCISSPQVRGLSLKTSIGFKKDQNKRAQPIITLSYRGIGCWFGDTRYYHLTPQPCCDSRRRASALRTLSMPFKSTYDSLRT